MYKTIEDVNVGDELTDKRTNSKAVVTDKTSSSVEVGIKKRKKTGIDCTHWHEMSWFLKFFTKS